MTFTDIPQLSIAFYMDSVPFTEAVLRKQSSLGGSESACRVLAEALARRGHDVHIYATKLEEPGEYFGVTWHAAESELPEILRFAPPDVFVSLRMPAVFQLNVPAKLRAIWNQDLLIAEAGVIGQMYGLDLAWFVSRYHLEQWCRQQDLLRPIARVIRNPIDYADLAAAGVFHEGDTFHVERIPKRAHSFIHISRPERGMDGLLALWPEIRARLPEATLSICRYSSMYDAGGWGRVCEAYDRMVARINEKVGGIEYLGELDKVSLYRAIAGHQVMLYPTSQPNFAETNCIAATEAQACGTPFVGSWRGALPETVHPEAGVLIPGDLTDSAVRALFVEACVRLTSDAALYRRMVAAGRAHAVHCDGASVAMEFEREVVEFFEQRYARNKVGVLRNLLHWDNHAAAKVVGQDILREYVPDARNTYLPSDQAAMDEAREAIALCERVIRQEEQTAEHYAKYAIQDPVAEAETNTRLHIAAEALAEGNPRLILDVACGNGAMAIVLAKLLPEARILGIDYSEGVLELAREAVEREGLADRVQFRRMTADTLAGGFAFDQPFDAVFCGEFIEHVERPWELLDTLEQFAAPNGRIVLTTPCGPFGELLSFGIPRQRGHVHAFTARDIAVMGASKRDWMWRYLGMDSVSARGSYVGYWIMGYRPGGGPATPLDYAHTILTERPYQRINAALIMRDGEKWLKACLESFRPVVDRIVIVDTGSVDNSVALARELGAEVYEREWPEDFSVARNMALDLALSDAPDWIYWQDCDEQLEGGVMLRRYAVDGGIFNGYTVHQHHLMLDAPNFHDTPVRLFRARREYRFFGVVHEQPETAPDQGIVPVLDQSDLKIVHLGYHQNQVRRQKMLQRNLPLLVKEIRSAAPRELAWVLYVRDCVNFALFDKEQHRGKLSARGLQHARQAIKIYHERGFDKPTSPQHRIAFPYYQNALELTGTALQVAWTFAAGQGGLTRAPRVGSYWAKDADEAEAIASHRVKTWCDGFRRVVVTDPAVIRLPVDSTAAMPGQAAGGRGWELPGWTLGDNRVRGGVQTPARV